ncbi:site-specific integrase [Pseudoalteromonas sp. MMG012]|uniref:tyrosine-type recombinase/integrase n=1 Tax=Pseudoalteromonas sp. MMG012 TaxID=2822686 RepID=UPI001B3A2E84|nr:site-specific integrase [Pseudoalteromonas sp. MMG012]MBQ4848815.1 tyrosine-type recombinase/integrase [Pseudoalteromonas sp. MMG012]
MISDTKLRSLLNKPNEPLILSHRDGLRVKRNKNGSISWQYRCRIGGKQALVTLGKYSGLTIKQAQELVPKLQTWLIEGKDPRIELKRGEANDHVPSISELAQQWLEKKSPTLKIKTQTLYANNISKWIAPYLNVQADTMTALTWVQYFDKINELGSVKSAGVLLVRLKTILRWAAMRGQIEPGNALFNLQVKDIGEPASVGQRFLQFNEVAMLWRQIDLSRAAPATKACLQLIFLTGARQSEVRLMKWEHLDFNNRIWTVPPENSKTNEAIRRPITPKMEEILNSLAALYGSRDHVIPGSSPRKPLTTHAVNRYCARVWEQLNYKYKIVKFLPHDARRSLSTLLIELEIPPHVTEKMLGHKMRGVMAIYNKHDYMKEQAHAYEIYWQKINEAIANLKS